MEDMLKSINMEHRTKALYRMGFVDMRLMLRLKKMDYQLMRLEWQDSTDEEIKLLQETVEKMAQLALVTEEEVVVVDYSERNKLTMGRLHIPGSVQAFEYLMGSFGGPPPIGLREVVISSPAEGCTARDQADLANKILVVKRGGCTFLDKALAAHRAGAVSLIIVNYEDRVDNVASGYGIDKTVTEQSLNEVSNLAIVSMANVTWSPLEFSARAGGLLAQMIPVKCQSAAICTPIIDEEKNINMEVSSGHMRLTAADGSGVSASFDFLTSTFGGRLPRHDIVVRVADPIDACGPLSFAEQRTPLEAGVSIDGTIPDVAEATVPRPKFAVYARRGVCRFDIKAKYAQDAGAELLIVSDNMDDALQRIGASKSTGQSIGMPGILVTAVAGEHIEETAQRTSLSVSLTPAKDDALAKAWIDLAFTDLYNTENGGADALLNVNGLIEQYSDKNSQEIVSWLGRKARRIAEKEVKAVDVA
jgi:hypothetical protein